MSAISVYNRLTEKVPKHLPQKTKKFYSHKYFHENSVFTALCCEVGFFTYSEKLVGSLFKIGQGKDMSIFQKRANKFFRSFYVGLKIVGTNSGILWKVGKIGGIL